MTTNHTSGRRGLLWAIIGGVVLVAGVVAIIISSAMSQPPENPTATQSEASTAAPSPSTDTPAPAFVDDTAAENGWTPEPITTDPAIYTSAALEAASTFDTTKSTREEWLDYLDTWFTPDTRYTSQADQLSAMQASQVELRQGVVLPQEEWDSLSRESGRVVATVSSTIDDVPVSDDASGDMSIGTANVTLTFTRSDADGAESSYDEQVRISVQVLCGAASVPTPDSAQQAGDCKVIRYFTEPLEP